MNNMPYRLDNILRSMNKLRRHLITSIGYENRLYSSSTLLQNSSSRCRMDPTAKRPNRICDPFGQNGQPMKMNEALSQLSLLDSGWHIERNKDSMNDTPQYLQKEYYHSNYIDGSKFISKIAAVAHNNNHYPSIHLERRLMKKEKAWRVVSTVICHTVVLEGLSFNDFHIAMLIDVEVDRNEVKSLLVQEEESLKKHT